MFGRGGPRRAAGRAGAAARASRCPAPTGTITLTIDFVEAATGGKQRLALSPDEWLDVTIPPGIEEGQVLRLKGKGGPGFGGGPPGDALIEVHVAPHPFFRREGDNIHVELPVSLAEAVLGARVPVPTVTGPVTMTIPKGSDTGARLRLRGKGIHRARARSDRRPVRDAEGRDRRQRRSRTGEISRRLGQNAPDRSAPRHGAAADAGSRGMIGFDELIAASPSSTRAELVRWVENRWVVPETAESEARPGCSTRSMSRGSS